MINLSGVRFISSTGLGILVHARSDFLVSGGMLRLCELRDRDISLLLYTKTMLLFEVYDTEAAAITAAIDSLNGGTELLAVTERRLAGGERSGEN